MPIIVVLAIAFCVGLLSLAAPVLSGRDLRLWEIGGIGLVAYIALALGRGWQLRRRRRRSENLRDSALW